MISATSINLNILFFIGFPPSPTLNYGLLTVSVAVGEREICKEFVKTVCRGAARLAVGLQSSRSSQFIALPMSRCIMGCPSASGHAQVAHPDSRNSSRYSQQKAFGEKLPDQCGSRGADRHANRNFLRASRSAS